VLNKACRRKAALCSFGVATDYRLCDARHLPNSRIWYCTGVLDVIRRGNRERPYQRRLGRETSSERLNPDLHREYEET